jgi:hypothetical protein
MKKAPPERTRKRSKLKCSRPHVRTLLYPFIRQWASYISEERKEEKEVVHAQQL